MRILLNYLYQYYPFTTASYIEMALNKDDRFQVFKLGEDRIPCADLIINIEPCEIMVSYPGIKSCYWEIDNHIHKGSKVAKYERVNHVFIAQKFFMDLYPKEKTSWLPLASYPDLHKLYEDEPILYDIGFLGNDTYPRRRYLLDELSKRYNVLRSTSKPGEEFSRKLSRCKLLFNCSMDNDINMRVFEAISTGRLLLTDNIKYQDELFTNGEHYVGYNDDEDLFKKVDYYLNNEKERNSIALTGANYVHAVHSYEQRLETILQKLGFYK